MSNEGVEPLLSDDLESKACCSFVSISRGRKALAVLLCVQMLERAAFYVLTLSIVVYTSFFLNFSPQAITATSVIFTGTTYFITPLFGWLADRKVGCFPLLVTSLLFYSLGAGLIAFSAYDVVASSSSDNEYEPHHYVIASYIVGLCLVSLSASSVRATLIPYMLEQLGDGSESKSVVSSFCTVAYFFINVGGALATGFSLFLCRVERPWVQQYADRDNYFWVSLSGSCFSLAAAAVLIGGRTLLRSRPTFKNENTPSLWSVIKVGCCCHGNRFYDDPSSKRKTSRESLAVLVPVFSSLIFYWITEVQYTSSFTEQSLRMNLGWKFNSTRENWSKCNTTNSQHNWALPQMLASLIDPVFILLVIPLYHWVIKPCWEAVMKREITMLDRIMLGLIFSLLGCLSATAVEIARVCESSFRYVCLSYGHTDVLYIFSPLSFLYQIPQYSLVGVSEVFALIAAMEFVLSRAPREVRCTAFGFYRCVAGIGYYIGAILIYVLAYNNAYYSDLTNGKESIQKQIDQEENSKAYAFFVCLDVLVFLNILVFACVKSRSSRHALC